jgi:hypothetical protein
LPEPNITPAQTSGTVTEGAPTSSISNTLLLAPLTSAYHTPFSAVTEHSGNISLPEKTASSSFWAARRTCEQENCRLGELAQAQDDLAFPVGLDPVGKILS